MRIGNDAYFMSADGMLMPIKKNQPPPDLRYFRQNAEMRTSERAVKESLAVKEASGLYEVKRRACYDVLG